MALGDVSKTKKRKNHGTTRTNGIRSRSLREASFSSDTVNATLSNGFLAPPLTAKASVKPPECANFYEIHGNGFVISISLDENGITDASWNKNEGTRTRRIYALARNKQRKEALCLPFRLPIARFVTLFCLIFTMRINHT